MTISKPNMVLLGFVALCVLSPRKKPRAPKPKQLAADTPRPLELAAPRKRSKMVPSA